MSLLGGFNMAPSSVCWTIQGTEKSKYDSIFDSLGPVSGKLSGDAVRPVLLNSKLPMETLGKVWELADIDKDGFLDREEFSVAMHLVYRAIEKEPVPSCLPTALIPPSKRNAQLSTSVSSSSMPGDKKLPGAIAVLPAVPSSPGLSSRGSTSSGISPKHTLSVASNPNAVPSQWVISAADRTRFSGIFQEKKDPDGLISGVAARDVFVQSGLPQPVLAHVWNLCDQQLIGKLKSDQFILAMHLISQKVKGVELPTQLTPEMLSQTSLDSGIGDTGSISDGSSGIGDSAAMRELDALNQEIEELRKEKEALTAEIQLKETSIRSVNNEVQELQDALDRDSSSLAQLECDKAEAHTRLEELEQQRNKLDAMLADVRLKVQEENENIKSLRAQISAQEASVSQQETDLRKVRNELAELKLEETQLEQRLEVGKQQQESVDHSVKEAQAEIAKIQGQMKQLEDQQKTVSANIDQYDKAITSLKTESDAAFGFDPFNNMDPSMAASESVFSMGGLQEKVEDIQKDLSEDPFKGHADPFKASDPFDGSDPFSEADPFASFAPPSTSASDPFTGSDPFAATATSGALATSPTNSTFPTEAFGSQDQASDPFAGQDPFASNAASSAFDVTPSSTFSSDPFGATDVFSSASSSTLNNVNKSDASTPSAAASGKSNANSLFDSGGFAKAFSDNEKNSESLFKDMGAFPKSTSSEKSSDPWGVSSAVSVTAAAGNDPFGGDSFSSSAFGSDPFDQPPPRPAKPDDYSRNSSKGSHKPSKHKGKAMSEAEQLAWAREESRKAEKDRIEKEKQEQADLELAIALSKQEGN